jgi:glycosyltransferase involved in cell wall biosynthesis
MNIQYHAINKYYCRAKKNIVIIAYPPSKYLSRAIMTIRHDLLIADFEDDTAERVDIKRRNEVIENYRKILPQCRWIFSTSPSLNEKYRNLAGQEIAYIPNGVDVNNFKAYHQHSYLKMKNQKTVGYIGIINREVDLDLLDYLLSCFKNISFFIIGYATEERLIDIKRLIAKYSNLHYLGYKCYKDIPDYISEFDVLINIKKPDHTTAGGESQKIYEYLLSGKPIVSTPVPPADRFSEIIYVAEDKYQFAENIKKALNEKNNDIKEKRKETALNNSWSKRTDDILFKIQSLLR